MYGAYVCVVQSISCKRPGLPIHVPCFIGSSQDVKQQGKGKGKEKAASLHTGSSRVRTFHTAVVV